MTGRSVPEWVGKTPDSAIPPRVQDRVWTRCDSRCHKCTRQHQGEGGWIIEHLIALINGGEHREGNLCLTCPWCKPVKDREDAAIKKKGSRVRKKARGIKTRKSKPMPGSRASGWKRNFDGTVERREK